MTDEHGTPSLRGFLCPICKRAVNLSRGEVSTLPRFFPFCSERCRLLDLGAWFDADYRIPGKPDQESEEAIDPGPGIDHSDSGE